MDPTEFLEIRIGIGSYAHGSVLATPRSRGRLQKAAPTTLPCIHGRACTFSRERAGWKPALQKRLSHDARAGVDAKSVSAAWQTVRQRAASLRRQRRRPGNSTTGDCRRRIAECDRRGRLRADVLRIRAPIKRLVAELHVQIPGRTHEMNARGIKSRREIRFGKIKKPGA